MYNPMDLSGKHVVVTGASSGIGRETAIRASKLGARVTIIARNEAAMQETISLMDSPEQHGYYVCDLTQIEEIESLVKTLVKERGAVDGFVHSAGIGEARPLKMTKYSYTDKMMKIHTLAFIELVRCLNQKSNLNDGASLVGVSSIAAKFGNVAQGGYSAAKAAMEGFLSPAAKELSLRRIRINAVAYAMVKTPMYEGFCGYASSKSQEELTRNQPLGLVELPDAANVILFLLSDAVRFITAASIPVFAGY